LVTGWQEGIGEKKKELTSIGYMKFDLLGLSAVSIIADAVNAIRKRHKVTVDFDNIDYKDKRIFRLCNNQHLCGIFQFDTQTGRDLIRRIKPESFMELSNISSLARPGTLRIGMDRLYEKRKFKREEYVIPEVIEDILADTYGIIIYQEQIMKICEKIGGFSLTEADNLRKILVKLSKATTESIIDRDDTKFLYEKFISNAKKYLELEKANKMWKEMINFAAYGFNKSHSVSYTMMSFRQLWLKAYYPLEFYYSLLLNTNLGEKDRNETSHINRIVGEALRLGVKVKPPDVNKSKANIIIDSDAILLGLTNIKNIERAAQELVEHQPYISIDDINEKVNRRIVNKRIIDSLKMSGTVDSILKNKRPFDVNVSNELEYVGVNLRYKVTKMKYDNIQDFKDNGNYSGLLISMKEIMSRNGRMCFLIFDGMVDKVIVWSKTYTKYKITEKLLYRVMNFKCVKKNDSLILEEML
jgi:DNA polymerase-3 subunit alpha